MATEGPRTSRRVRVLAAVAVLLLGLVVLDPTLVALDGGEGSLRKGPDAVKLVPASPEGETRLWPYTSRSHSFESLTLPINVVLRTDAARVRTQLTQRHDATFDPITEEWQGVAPEGDIPAERPGAVWTDTTGATRYTYVDTPGPGGRWIDETAQFHDGTYFGSRYHLRLYEFRIGATGPRTPGTSSVTAVQAHYEYWDWFRLRHTVTSLAKARKHLESQYFGQWYVTDVARGWYANGGIIDSDGWVTLVEFRPGVSSLAAQWAWLVVGLAAGERALVGRLAEPTRRLTASRAAPRALALAAVLALLPSAVRAGAIAGELGAPWVHVKVVTGAFYLLLVGGLPAAAVALPRGAHAIDWLSLAVLSLGVGFLLDLSAIGVRVLPVAVVLHRLLALAVIGLLAAGGARRAGGVRRNPHLAAGLGLWLAVLAWPLFLGF